MSEPPALSIDALLADLDARTATRRSASAAAQAADAAAPYRRAAAVLHVFDPVAILPEGGAAAGGQEGRVALLDEAVAAIGWRHAGLRTLRLNSRRSALRDLGSREAMRAALAANPRRTATRLQRLFERWLDGEVLRLDRMSYVELECLGQLYDWGLDGFGGLPPRDRVELARVRRSAVAVFEHLVDRDFVGRTAELDLLNAHLRAPGPGGPLAIWGPGGAGKTALIGRFLIEHVEDPARRWFPFAYLPFDSATLDVREPFTLLVAIAAQLEAQAGGRPGAAGFRRQLADFQGVVGDYRDLRGSLQRRAGVFQERGSRISTLSDADARLHDAFARVLDAARTRGDGGAETPVLLVFDTFEEVVYRAAEDLLGFWSLLDHLGSRVPQLRVVIAGRGRADLGPAGGPTSEIALGDLDPPDAVRLLTRLGLDADVADAVARQIGGNPMSLRLAASVARQEPAADGISGLEVHDIGAEIVRGQLYRRLLDHIHDDAVRALAHPGMVLRRVTAGVIEHVLAPAIDLPPLDDKRAGELLDALRREQALVGVEQDGSLWYREEVRRPVLALLLRDRPAQVRRIHEQAVRYYTQRDTAADRAEELYHRMMLRQSPGALDGRWMPGVERHLASAVEEIPPAQRRWLAGRMSIELSPAAYRLADVGEWERLVGRRALELVRHAGAEAVLTLLGEREYRTPESPLFAVEARALLDLGRPNRAAALLDAALQGYPPLGNPGRLAELLWLRAQAAEAAGDTARALSFLERLARLAATLPSGLARVQALTETLGLLGGGSPGEHRLGPARSALASALARLTEAEVGRERSLVRLALVRLGPSYPGLLADLARQTVFDLAHLARQGLVEIEPAVELAARLLVDDLPRLAALAAEAADARSALLSTVLGEVVEALHRRTRARGAEQGPVTALVQAVLAVLAAERTTLSAASLAGVDDYREPWELEGTAEVAP